LNIKFIIIGDDFRFGSKRNGNISLLKEIGYQYNFKVIEISSLLYKNKIKISSTNIRKCLLENKIELARKLLGRPFSISGRVIHGNKIGRKLGYPTANISLRKNIPLNNGVYAVKISCFFNKKFVGICNIGIKPSYFSSKKHRLLEVHLFNFNLNLYEEKIEVFLYKKIRNECFFSSKNKLKEQISKDIEIVKKYFNLI
jgi:riboflavin kinase/FMN adenylyltransferase